jgi:hypothetical protein
MRARLAKMMRRVRTAHRMAMDIGIKRPGQPARKFESCL